MTSLFSLAKDGAGPEACISAKTRQRSNIWGVVEAMLSQVGRLTEPGGRREKKRETAEWSLSVY